MTEIELKQIALCKVYAEKYSDVPFPNANLYMLVAKLAAENERLRSMLTMPTGIVTTGMAMQAVFDFVAYNDTAHEEYTEFQRKVKGKYGRK